MTRAKTKTKLKTKVSTKTLVAVTASAVVLASAAAGFASLNNSRFSPSYFSGTSGYQPQGYQPNPNPTPGYQPTPTPGYQPTYQIQKRRASNSLFRKIFQQKNNSSVRRYQ